MKISNYTLKTGSYQSLRHTSSVVHGIASKAQNCCFVLGNWLFFPVVMVHVSLVVIKNMGRDGKDEKLVSDFVRTCKQLKFFEWNSWIFVSAENLEQIFNFQIEVWLVRYLRFVAVHFSRTSAYLLFMLSAIIRFVLNQPFKTTIISVLMNNRPSSLSANQQVFMKELSISNTSS